MVGECRVNVSSPGKVGWPMLANVSSPANFPKWPFWRVLEFAKNGEFFLRVLEFDKFAGEWPLLRFSTFVKYVFFICFSSATDLTVIDTTWIGIPENFLKNQTKLISFRWINNRISKN
jgi:hypothetical protein